MLHDPPLREPSSGRDGFGASRELRRRPRPRRRRRRRRGRATSTASPLDEDGADPLGGRLGGGRHRKRRGTGRAHAAPGLRQGTLSRRFAALAGSRLAQGADLPEPPPARSRRSRQRGLTQGSASPERSASRRGPFGQGCSWLPRSLLEPGRRDTGRLALPATRRAWPLAPWRAILPASGPNMDQIARRMQPPMIELIDSIGGPSGARTPDLRIKRLNQELPRASPCHA